MDKIFGIGFHKTGTKSLAVALRRLGYRVTGPNGTMDPDIAGNALPNIPGQADATRAIFACKFGGESRAARQ